MWCNDFIGKGLRSGTLLASTLTSVLKRNDTPGASKLPCVCRCVCKAGSLLVCVCISGCSHRHGDIRDLLEIIHYLFSVLLTTSEPEGSLAFFPNGSLRSIFNLLTVQLITNPITQQLLPNRLTEGFLLVCPFKKGRW